MNNDNAHRLDEVAEVVDSLHQTPSYSKKGLPMIRVTDIKGGPINLKRTYRVTQQVYDEFTKKYRPRKGDILMTRVGSYGTCSYINTDENFCLGQNTVVIKPKINSKYLYYCLITRNIKNQIKSFVTGSTQKTISLKNINSLEIPIHSCDKEILNIATTLSDIDAKIELNNKINDELEAMAKLIYDYWFVQFNFPDANTNGKPYKTSGGKMVYDEELKREIPYGWIGTEINQALRTELGGTPSTKVKEYWNGNIPWLNSGEIANFPIVQSEDHITSNAIDNSAASLMPKGTCVLSITRHLRPSILAVEACANQSVVGIYESEELKSSYLYPYLKNEIPRLMSLRTGAQQPHINKGIVDASFIVLPPNEVLKAYYEKVTDIYVKIDNGAFQNKELAKLRDWLLPMLMNGQVTVKDLSPHSNTQA